jgi:DMSO/TMAO reductase YedYZ molybdopterin-dependent catalytic subunit
MVCCSRHGSLHRGGALGRIATSPAFPHSGKISAQSVRSAVKIPIVATPNPSLIERKERWARKMAGKAKSPDRLAKPLVQPGNPPVRLGPRSSDRLPPGQHLTQGFPILDLGIKPEIALKDWRLEIGGLVENPKTFTWEEFKALPQFEDVSDFHCVTRIAPFCSKKFSSR